ncbi:unnamed protein product [Nesidiocoris tenuis]|uniref:Uncharacterized protein n=1 Tax=Nesidiocoris tenuis TaxID=355587 RepID=A0A6H5H9S0_9HEMI|nr:unnamed protein product [Nesidiocoris tenuis]
MYRLRSKRFRAYTGRVTYGALPKGPGTEAHKTERTLIPSSNPDGRCRSLADSHPAPARRGGSAADIAAALFPPAGVQAVPKWPGRIRGGNPWESGP